MYNEAEITSRRMLAWSAWVAGYMKMLNKQFVGLLGFPEMGFNDLSENGKKQVETEFEEWWKS